MLYNLMRHCRANIVAVEFGSLDVEFCCHATIYLTALEALFTV